MFVSLDFIVYHLLNKPIIIIIVIKNKDSRKMKIPPKMKMS